MNKQKLYSYVRWSSEKQAAGTSLSRQSDAAREFAADHNLEYVEVIDAGVSAFKGKNAEHGALADFIEAVEAGAIRRDSWLYVENLDRLSRQKVRAAQRLFDRLLDLGLTIVTGMDQRIYTAQSVDDNFADLLISLFLFSRANEESETKSKRTRGNALKLIDRFNAGQPVNIKSVGAGAPFWIDDSGSQYEAVRKHPVHWAAAQKIVQLLLDGWGPFRIAVYLNENLDKYPAPVPAKVRGKARRLVDRPTDKDGQLQQDVHIKRRDASGNAITYRQETANWVVANIKSMRKNPALYGLRMLKIGGEEFKLPGYYPPVCSEIDFLRIQEIAKSNRASQGETLKVIPLISGIGVTRCGHCGAAMVFFNQRGRIRYVCEGGKGKMTACNAWTMNGPIVENCTARALLYGHYFDVLDNGAQNADLTPQIEQASAALATINGRIEIAVDTLLDLGRSDELSSRIRALEGEKQRAMVALDDLKRQQAAQQSAKAPADEIIKTLKMLNGEVLKDTTHTARWQIRELARKLFRQITLSRHDDKSYRLAFTYINGESLIFEGIWQTDDAGKPKKSFRVYRISADGEPFEEKLSAIADRLERQGLEVDRASLHDETLAWFDQMLWRYALPPLEGKEFFSQRAASSNK